MPGVGALEAKLRRWVQGHQELNTSGCGLGGQQGRFS